MVTVILTRRTKIKFGLVLLTSEMPTYELNFDQATHGIEFSMGCLRLECDT